MAIIIPKSKIYNYNFNILQNNYVNYISSNIKNVYNYEDINVNINANIDNSSWSVESYSDWIYDINLIPPSNWKFTDCVPFTASKDGGEQVTHYKVFHYFQLTLIVPANVLYLQDVKKIPISVTIKVTYNDETVDEGEAQISYTDSERPSLSPYNMGLVQVNTHVDSFVQNYKYLRTYCNFMGGIASSLDPFTWEKKVKKIEVFIKCNKFYEDLDYVYDVSSGDELDKLSFSNTSMMDINIGQLGAQKISQPIYERIAMNIISKYYGGRMTMEIETRYTNFVDENGVLINEGKPYLIKVGDIVKPQMLEKFSSFEYEYIVTSVEYEYEGSDKVFLKLLQR